MRARLADLESEAMVHVIEAMAPDHPRALIGCMLHALNKGTYPGVAVQVDWSAFLERDQAQIDLAYSQRLAETVAAEEAEEEAARLFKLRSERIKAGLDRRRSDGLPVGRRTGARDKRPRKRSGYIARYEREREAS